MGSAAQPALALRPVDRARALAAAGFHVFPLNPWPEGDNSPGKEPAVKFKDWATRDVEKIDAWWSRHPTHGVAIYTGRYGEDGALVALDVDTKNGKDGNAALLGLELQGLDLPDTREHGTPTGGRHLLFSVPQPVKQGANVLGPGLDTRSRGGYVVAPGTRIDGKEYVVLHDRPIAPAPEWLIKRCGAADKRSPSDAPAPQSTAPDDLTRAIRFLKNDAPLAIEGQGGDITTFRTAARLKDFGVAQADALALMLELWNSRCSPPWAPDELRAKTAHAYEYGREAPGSASPTQDFEPVDAPVPLRNVLKRTPQPVAELIPHLIEKGIPTFLDGPGGSCKSRLALQLGICLSAGAPVFGNEVERCHFVHLSSEDGADEVTRRTHAITTRLMLAGDQLDGVTWDRKDKDSALAEVKEGGEIKLLPFYQELVKLLHSVPGHKFVVLDSLYDFVRFVGSAKIDEGSVNAFIKRTLGGLCTETNSTLLVIRHPSQAGIERGDASGWSVANHNAPRARLSMTVDKNARDAYVLKVEKRNHGSCGEPVTLHWSEGALLPRSALQDDEARGKLYEAVIDVARQAADAGSPITRQAHIKDWQIAEIEQRIGHRPTQKEVKDELSRAVVSIKSLVYMPGTNRRAAGYYPADDAETRAKALRNGVENRPENRRKTDRKTPRKTG